MSEFSKKTKAELEKELTAKREGLRKFRFGVSGSSQRNVREGRAVRRDIARILTALKTAAK